MGNSPGNLIVNPCFRDTSVRDGFLQFRAPVDASIGHCNIKPSQRGCNSCILCAPIRDNKSLEAKLCLQEPVQGVAVGTAIGIVDALIRAHKIGTSSMDSVLEWPVELSKCALGSGEVAYQRYSSCIVWSSILEETDWTPPLGIR